MASRSLLPITSLSYCNSLDEEKRRRTVEILKFRGTTHQKGEFPFTVVPHRGIVVVPIASFNLLQPSSSERVTSGNAELDEMCGSGFFRDSMVLVSGATGTGKTLLTAEFLMGGLRRGERCLLFAFEESEDQIVRNAAGVASRLGRISRMGASRWCALIRNRLAWKIISWP